MHVYGIRYAGHIPWPTEKASELYAYDGRACALPLYGQSLIEKCALPLLYRNATLLCTNLFYEAILQRF